MPTPQQGVLPAGGAHAYFLTFTVADGAERRALSKAIRDILPSARALAKKAKRARLYVQSASGLNSGTGSRRRDAQPDSVRSAPSRQMGESHRLREEIFFADYLWLS